MKDVTVVKISRFCAVRVSIPVYDNCLYTPHRRLP